MTACGFINDVSAIKSECLIMLLVTKTTSMSPGLSNDVVTMVLSLFSLTLSEKERRTYKFHNVKQSFFKAETK